MAQDICDLIDGIIAREGGYVDHPADKGGPTCFGITERVARAAGYDGAMARLPRELAAEIYRDRYWRAPRFDAVARHMPKLAAELLDTAVNMGVGVAAGFLQRALNALNRQQRDWPDVPPTRAVDGATLAALDTCRRRRGEAAEEVLVAAVNALQGARYIELAEMRPANEAFVYGWLANRVLA